MNQRFKEFLRGKANKTIAIMLSLAMLLTMLPTFVLPVSAAAISGNTSQGNARAYVSNSTVLMGGKYMEVGVTPYGTFGGYISGSKDAGWHGSVANVASNAIGLRYDSSGTWTTPVTTDFFLPGTVDEGYSIGYGMNLAGLSDKTSLSGMTQLAYAQTSDASGNYSSNSVTLLSNTSEFIHDDKKGDGVCTTTKYTVSSLKFTQKVYFYESDKFFITDITVDNPTATAYNDFTYLRHFDPDQGRTSTCTNIYATKNFFFTGGTEANGGTMVVAGTKTDASPYTQSQNPFVFFVPQSNSYKSYPIYTSVGKSAFNDMYTRTNGQDNYGQDDAMGIAIQTDLAAKSTFHFSYMSSLDNDISGTLHNMFQTPTAPTVDTNGYTSGTWTTDDVKFNVSGASADGGIAKYQYSTDDGATWSDMNTTAELVVNTDTSGINYLFRAVSNAGYDGLASSATVVEIDKTPPVISSVDSSPASWTNSEVTLTVTANDAQSGLATAAYSFDGGTTWQSSASNNYTSNTTINAGTIKVKNVAGIVTAYNTAITIDKIDTVKPTIDSVTGNPDTWTNKDATLTVTANDAQSGLAPAAYSFDNGANWQTDNFKTFSANQTVAIKVKDSAGNISAVNTVAITKIDKVLPSSPTISYGTDNFKEFLNTITFGLFFKNTVTVTLTATDTGSNIKAFKYTLNGTEQTIAATIGSASFQILPQYKGNISNVKAIDNAGNESALKTTENFAVDNQAPAAPTVGTNGYTSGTWTNSDVKVTASGASATSGIAKYQYSTNGITWTDMNTTEKTDGTATEPYNATKAELTIRSDMNGSFIVRAVSNSGIVGEITSVPVKRDTVIPKLSVGIAGTLGQWTENPVTFALSNTENNISPVTYWVKIGSGDWTQLSGNTYKVTGNVNTTYQFKAVSGSGLASSASDIYTVKLASDALKEVIKDIDNLPDPDNTPDNQITDNEQAIKDTKILYDTLSKDEQSAVGQSRIDKLNKLIGRLNSLLVIIPKDTNTGITAGNIGTSVNLPELNDPDVGKVVVKLAVNPVTSSGTQNTNIALASVSLGQSGTNLVAAYDVSLIKSVFDSVGNQTSSGKVSNSSISGPITIRIPVPESYQGRTDLQVVYIDDSGNVTPLTTTLVTVDGVQYLQFTTTHFSVYAVTAPEKTSSVSNPKTGNDGSSLPAGITPLFEFAILSASVDIVLRRKKKAHKTSK